MTAERDPMLYGSTEEQQQYQQKIAQLMSATIEEDRANRHQPADNERRQQPALIGGTSVPGGLNASL